MEIFIQSAILGFSLAFVAYSATVLIDSTKEIADATGLGEMTLGFIMLSVITSLPEMTVAIFSASAGVAGISVGDILGSNLINITFVLGVCILVKPFRVVGKSFEELSEVLFLSSLIPLILTQFMPHAEFVGGALLGTFLFFTYFSAKRKIALVKRERLKPEINKIRVTAMTLLGASGVFLGARFAVESAAAIAHIMQIPQVIIGAKIVAIGTSLPELMIDCTAVRKGHYEMALGDLLGSNLVNITLIFGSLLIATHITLNLAAFSMEIAFVLIASMTLWYFLSKGRFKQREGIILILIYVLFQAILR